MKPERIAYGINTRSCEKSESSCPLECQSIAVKINQYTKNQNFEVSKSAKNLDFLLSFFN